MPIMKAIVIDRFVESLDDVKVSDTPLLEPHDGFLVQVHAAGVNFVDILYAQGKHQNNTSLVRPPFTLGLEFSGTVLSVPRGTTAFRPGDRVFGGHTGSYAEVLSLPATASLRHVPSAWDLVGAAGICATLPVSYGALVLRAGLKRGQTVLVHAAAGGLGIMAVQIAAALGCRVIGTAGSAQKCAIARKYGATACLDYTQDAEWWKRVLEMTDGKGADVVFDPVGLVDRSLKCIAHFGKLLVVGFAGGEIEKIAMNRVLLKQVSIVGYRYGETLRRAAEEDDLIWQGLQPLIDAGKIVPVVYDRTYTGLASVPQALKDLSSRRTWGKAVILLDQTTHTNGAKL